MIERFLKAKHWQLFALMFGIPLVFQIVMMASIFLNISIDSSPKPKINEMVSYKTNNIENIGKITMIP